jgi:hypothetical protein
MVTSDDRRLGVFVRAAVHGSRVPAQERESMASAILAVLSEKREEIFADRSTPLRSFPLTTPIGRFTHLVVLSPTTENVTICRNVNISNPILGRSLYRAFPAFECETTGNETVSVAEARCSGRGAILSAHWDRGPHPVFDLAYLKLATETPKFLVYDPKELERRLSVQVLTRLAVAEVQARNHLGVVRRFLRGDEPDLDELRAFFGYRS